MPIVLEGSALPDEQIAALRAQFREGVAETLELIQEGRFGPTEAASLSLATDLARDLLTVVDAPAVAQLDRTTRIAVTNLSYDVMLALLDIVKSHRGGSKVPAPRRST